jgi:hypothetical protein
MANLRGGVESDRRVSQPATRLADRRIFVWANTWHRMVRVDLERDGRVSIMVDDDGENILRVELPANEGDHKDSFAPRIRYRGVDVMPAILAQILGK